MRVRVFLLAALVLALFPVTAAADYPHVVQPGETLTSVAHTDGLSIGAIARANGISSNAELVIGQILEIPPRTVESTALATTSTSTVRSTATSTPESTDSESSEEAAETESSGHETPTSTSEQTSYTHSKSSSRTSSATTASTDASGSGAPSGSPQPTAERIPGSEIAYIARLNGVPASLAEAVAWQESGWNNAEVSSIGAVGVMQIVPSTWSWIDRYLTPSNPLGTASAAENVRAGVLLLHQLLQMTGGNEQLAVAGYYQGIASVQAHGMYRDTRQYVADVLSLAQRLG